VTAAQLPGEFVRKVLLIVLVILAFCSIAIVAYTWVNDLVDSIYEYRTPLKGTPPPTQNINRPLTSQVVLVLIDGLRYDTSQQMPNLNLLRTQGAHAVLTSCPPSNAQSAWTTIVSGTGPEINDAPLFDHGLEWIVPVATDHLFAAIDRAGLTSGITGSQRWEKLVPTDLLYTTYFVDAEDADEQVLENALVFLDEFRPNFLLVHLQQIEAAGREHGGASPEYYQAALQCDVHIRSLAAHLNLQRSVLLVASSYGHLDAGGHGGDEAIVLHTPFVMVGQNVLPGDYHKLGQIDLAPTIAALLGIPMPSAAQGRMQVDMLKMNSVDKAEKWVSLASQRARLGSIYLLSIDEGPLPESAEGDMLVALSSLQIKNYESATKLASLSVHQTDRDMVKARRARIWKERMQRAVPVALVLLIPLWIIWRSRGKRTAWSALAALLAAALYHALFLRQGNTYSFSQMPVDGLAAILDPSLRRAAIAMAVGAVFIIWRTWYERERSIFAVIMRAYGYTALQLYFVGLVIGAITWWNGLHFRWYLPNFTVAYVHFAVLMQAMLSAAMATLLPVGVVVLQRGLLVITDHFASASGKGQKVAHSR